MNDCQTSPQQSAEGTSPAPVRASDPPKSWRSEELLGDRTEVQILHNEEVYRLRRTRQGKLILYK